MPPRSAVRIGALVPLSRPGWVEAGRQLLAGLELGVEEANGTGVGPIELVVHDTAADPQRAIGAVEELAAAGVVALAGEYHSVVARAVAARAHALELPFLCSSAVLDALIDEPTPWVARLAPPQSRGWASFADFLLAAGHRRIAVAAQPSLYWSAGIRILRAALVPAGGTVLEVDGSAPAAVPDDVHDGSATALLLLAGHPEPAGPIVHAVRADPRLRDVLIGAPAGQPELADWVTSLGGAGTGVPFLRYLPPRLGPRGVRVEAALRRRLGAPPSFVAFEGYDTIAVLAELLRAHGPERSAIAAGWPDVAVDGSRGTITFERLPGIGPWQWPSAPIQVVDRDPAAPERVRLLHQA